MARDAAKLDASAWRELRRLDELRLLDDGEILCEVEAAGIATRAGAIIVTDQRVLFVSTTLLRKQTRVDSIPLREIRNAEASSRRGLGREHGELTLGLSGSGQADRTVRFEAIPGGQTRAEEIARTILRQHQYLQRRVEDPLFIPPSSDAGAEPQTAEAEPRLRISLGRGVESYVKAHGGRLYVWGDPVGGFQWIKTSAEPPEGLDFVRFDGVDTFELYVDESMRDARPLRLARRWWLPGGGIVVDTGLVMGP